METTLAHAAAIIAGLLGIFGTIRRGRNRPLHPAERFGGLAVFLGVLLWGSSLWTEPSMSATTSHLLLRLRQGLIVGGVVLWGFASPWTRRRWR